VIQSHNGLLNATLIAQSGPITVDGQLALNAATYNGLFPGPTIQFNPGDQVNIDLVNHLTDGPLAQHDAFGPTNIHLHGLHVSPDGNSDNVFLQVDPGQDNHYHYDIPADQPEGLYWYHAHVHGFVSAQMWDGLSGLLIVGRADGGAPELNGLTQHVLAIKNFEVDPTTHLIPDQPNENPGQSFFTVNGLVNPTMSIRPGEAQVWSVADMGNDPFYNVALVNANGVEQTLYVVAEDGEPLTKPEAVQNLDLSPGKRYSFIVQVSPNDPVGTTYSFQNVGFYDGQGNWPVRTLATLQVQGTPVTTPFQIPAHLSPPNNLFHDLTNAPIVEHRVVTFGQTATTDTINGQQFPDPPVFQARLNTVEEWELVNVTPFIHVFHIHQNNFQVMSVNGIAVPADGTPVFIPDFSFPNAPSDQNPQGETIIGGGLTDIIDIPAADPVTGAPGTVVIRMEFKDFTGKYVYHCHIVDHEDMGMMGIINVVPNDPIYAAGAGADAPPVVNVYDSLTGQLKTSFLAFDPRLVRDGISVAVANLYGDNRQQIVVGAGPGSPPLVRVFDENGQPLPGKLGTGFLAYDKSFRGGVNVAVGDVNGDGIQDIITGEEAGATSQPRIRAFSGRDGSKLLDFLAFERSFHGGVRVAAEDVTGNGRIQIIAGRGPGSTPEVKVFRTSDQHVMDDFLAFDRSFRGGVYVATGWIKGFAFPDVIVGAGPGLPEVRVFSNLMTMDQMMMNNMNDMVDLTLWNQITVPGFVTGVHVAERFDADGTGDDLLVAPGPMHPPIVQIYQTETLAPDGAFFAFSPFYFGGVDFGATDVFHADGLRSLLAAKALEKLKKVM